MLDDTTSSQVDNYMSQLLNRPQPVVAEKTSTQKEAKVRSLTKYNLICKVYLEASAKYNAACKEWETWNTAGRIGKAPKGPTCYDVVMEALLFNNLHAERTLVLNLGEIIRRKPVNYIDAIREKIRY